MRSHKLKCTTRHHATLLCNGRKKNIWCFDSNKNIILKCKVIRNIRLCHFQISLFLYHINIVEHVLISGLKIRFSLNKFTKIFRYISASPNCSFIYGLRPSGTILQLCFLPGAIALLFYDLHLRILVSTAENNRKAAERVADWSSSQLSCLFQY